MLSDEIKQLEETNKELKIEKISLTLENENLKEYIKKQKDVLNSLVPNQVYTHKKRRNTTVVFLDGSSQTVKRIKGEKDCIETAIAYCVLKQLMTAKQLKYLIKNREEH